MTISQEIKEERGKRVRIVRNMTGLSIVEFAENLNVTGRSIIGWEGGKAGGLTEKAATRIAEITESLGVECSPIWLMHGIGTQPVLTNEIYNRPIVAEVVSEDKREEVSGVIQKEMEFFQKSNPNAVVTQLSDNSMEPHFKSGDIVGGVRLFGRELKKAVNKDCIVETGASDIICRMLLSGSGGKLFNLSCINPKTEVEPFIINDAKIISAAPIVWIRRISY